MRSTILIVVSVLYSTIPLFDSSANTPSKALERQQIIRLVMKEAKNMQVPTALALAVAQVESNFNTKAKSHKGARGVMQIMPQTARGEYGIEPGLLWNPRINIRLGLHFLRRLLDRYKGRVDLALSYYNGGSAVGDLPNARVIPATRKYVRKVQTITREFRRKLTGTTPSKSIYIGHNDTGDFIIKRGAKRRIGRLLPSY